MDSHISKGNNKRMKQVTEESFIFSKSTYNLVFSALGFENNITQVVAVIRDTLPKPFSKVFHHYVGHLWGNGGNFLANSVLKCFEGLRPMFINLGLEVSPQEKITGGQIGRACGPPEPRKETSQLGNISLKIPSERQAEVMGVILCPIPKILLVHSTGQMEMCLIAAPQTAVGGTC